MTNYGQLILTILFGCSCWAAGQYVLDYFFSKKNHFLPWAKPVIAFTLGNVIYSYCLTALGFWGFYSHLIFKSLLLFGVTLFIFQVVLHIKKNITHHVQQKIILQSAVSVPQVSGSETTIIITTGLVIGFFLVPVIMQAALPPYFRDSLVYHLLLPKLYLQTGSLTHLGGNLYSAFPKGQEVLMTLLMSVAGDRAAQGFSILQQITAIAGVYTIARYLSGPLPAAVCTLGFATVPSAVYFSGCGYVEPALIMTLTSSVLLWIHVFREDALTGETKLPSRPKIFLLGLIAGWLPAIKYTGLIYTGIIIFMILWPYRKTPFNKIYPLICMFILGVTPGFCWMIWNWMTLGNPVYPFAGAMFGGLGWSDATSRAMSIYMDHFGMGKQWLDYFLIPWRLAFSGKLDTVYFDGAMGPFLLVFILFAIMTFFIKSEMVVKKTIVQYMAFASITSAAFFIFGTQQARFWLPTQVLICLCAVPAVHYLIGRIRGKKIIQTLCAILLVSALTWNYYYLFHRWNEIGIYKPILGLESESSFLKRKVPGYPVMDYINRNLPDTSRIFSVWTGGYAYYMDRLYYSDTFLEDVTLKRLIDESVNGKDLAVRLKKAGFTHLFVNLYLTEHNLEPDQLKIFRDFIKNDSQSIFDQGNYFLLALYK